MTQDWEAVGPLYAREHANLVRYARTIVGSDAEDVVHEAFIRLAAKISDTATYESEINDVAHDLGAVFPLWGTDSGKDYAEKSISTIVHRLCLNHLRDNPPTEVLKPEFIEGVSRTADDQFFTTDFNEALQTLPPKQAQAFILCEVRGVSQEEAARIIGTSQPTVCRRVETARHSLASLL